MAVEGDWISVSISIRNPNSSHWIVQEKDEDVVSSRKLGSYPGKMSFAP